MADLNKVMLIGRLTRDPTLKVLTNNNAVCEFGLATGRKYKLASGEEREETTFVDCTLFGKGAEIFNKYTQKGKLVFVEGRLKLDTWEDKNGGGKRSKMSVTVENFQFLGGKDDGGGGNRGGGDSESYDRGGSSSYDNNDRGGYGSGDSPRRAPQQQQRAPQKPAEKPPYDEDESHFGGDDVPF